MRRVSESHIAVLFGIVVIAAAVLMPVDAAAQMIHIGTWEFEQRIDGQIGHILACRTNVPTGGDFNDSAMTQPILRARAEVGESSNPVSNCAAHVTAEAELRVTQAPTLVTIECEARGSLSLEKEPGAASISAKASIMDPSGIATYAWTDCSPSTRTTVGLTEVIEFHSKEVCLEPGEYLITSRLDVDAEIGLGAQFEVADANMLDRIPSTGLHVYVEDVGGCPVLPTFAAVQDFDSDRNRFLSDLEFFGVVDAWINGQISDQIFFAAIDFWINIARLPVVASSTAQPVELSITSRADGVVFAASSASESKRSLQVNIMSLSGERVYVSQTSNNQLRWGYQSNAWGTRVANGVYLAQVDAFDGAGRLIASEMKRIVVLR